MAEAGFTEEKAKRVLQTGGGAVPLAVGLCMVPELAGPSSGAHRRRVRGVSPDEDAFSEALRQVRGPAPRAGHRGPPASFF